MLIPEKDFDVIENFAQRVIRDKYLEEDTIKDQF